MSTSPFLFKRPFPPSSQQSEWDGLPPGPQGWHWGAEEGWWPSRRAQMRWARWSLSGRGKTNQGF